MLPYTPKLKKQGLYKEIVVKRKHIVLGNNLTYHGSPIWEFL